MKKVCAYCFNENVTKSFNGRAQIILKKTDENVPVNISVQSESGLSASLTL